MVAMVKARRVAFETMVSGIVDESAYYESPTRHRLANTIARKKLYEMNVGISDTAEYGNYLDCSGAHCSRTSLQV